MPRKEKKSGFFKKHGRTVKKAHEATRSNETTYSNFGELPAGIENGIARLVSCEIKEIAAGKQNAGEYLFNAQAVVVHPVEHDGVRCEGKRTSIIENLFETPGKARETLEEHWDWMLNELRKMGVDTEDLDAEDVEQVMEELVEEGVYISFRTWKGEPTKAYPNPRVNHNWEGAAEWDEEEGDSPDDHVEDETGDEDEEVEKAPKKSKKKPPKKKPDPEPEDDDEDLSELADLADEEDEDAAERLTELAEKAGIDDDTIEEAESWHEIVKLIEEGDEPDDDDEPEDEDEDDEAEPPTKGELFNFYPVNARTKRKARKPVEVAVTTVNKGKQTANVKETDSGTVHKSVPWDDLEVPDDE